MMGGFQYCLRFFRFVPKGICPSNSNREFIEPLFRDCIYRSEIKKGKMDCCQCYCPCKSSEPAMLSRLIPSENVFMPKIPMCQLNKLNKKIFKGLCA